MPSVEKEMESTSFKNVDPCNVRVRVSEFGFGASLDAIIQFHWERGEELRTGFFRQESDQSCWIYFCFNHAGNADEFAKRFNGEQFRFPFERDGERSHQFEILPPRSAW